MRGVPASLKARQAMPYLRRAAALPTRNGAGVLASYCRSRPLNGPSSLHERGAFSKKFDCIFKRTRLPAGDWNSVSPRSSRWTDTSSDRGEFPLPLPPLFLFSMMGTQSEQMAVQWHTCRPSMNESRPVSSWVRLGLLLMRGESVFYARGFCPAVGRWVRSFNHAMVGQLIMDS